jgi:hypothetical protein
VLDSGSYEANNLLITIECSTGGADIYYTTDESTPTTGSTLYTGNFTIEASKTIKAIAAKSGMSNSNITSEAYDLYWWQPLSTGLNDLVQALAIDPLSGDLYLGGLFNQVVGGASMPRMAKWNGLSFSNIGSFNDAIYSLVYKGSNLYAVGDFTTINVPAAIPVSRVAKWNGSSWSSIEGTTNNTIYACAIDSSDNIYIGGFITTITTSDTLTVNRIAKYDQGANHWSSLGTGMDNYVRALVFDSDGDLFAGGNFTSADAVADTKNIAKWSGSSWSALGTGMDSNVNALAADLSGNVFAGGSFSTAGGTSAIRIAKWNGSAWSALGGGLGGDVHAICLDPSGNVYAGGNFTQAESTTTVNNIAKWNGSSWLALGGGMNGQVRALISDSAGNIYAGGYFTSAGGVTANRIAKWGKKN